MSKDSREYDGYDPFSLHKYLYANANPINYLDPNGKSPLLAIPALMAAFELYATRVATAPDFQSDMTMLQMDMASGDHLAVAIDAIALAIPGVAAGEVRGAVEAVEQTAKSLKRAKKAKTFSRFMSKAEAEAVESTGLLRGGRKGPTYVSVNKYQTVKSAKSKCALKDAPEVRMDFEIKNNPAMTKPEIVKPKYGEQGGGIEMMIREQVEVEIIRKRQLR